MDLHYDGMTQAGEYMNDEIINNQQQVINQLLRSGQGVSENSFVTSAGGKIAGFAAEVISKYDYNHYYVRAVEIYPPGLPPGAIGAEIIAVNVAESFDQQGTLPVGTIVLMFKMGEYYCFYAKP